MMAEEPSASLEKAMTEAASPFPLQEIEPELEAVRAHWSGMIRGDNQMPFWDDFAPSALPKMADRLFLLDVVFDQPSRFRFSNVVATELEGRYGGELRGLFSDELQRRAPFEYLTAQAHATLEGGQPTYYRAGAYARLLAPMWCDGRIGMLLGAVVWR
jgi:hypothetical protein